MAIHDETNDVPGGIVVHRHGQDDPPPLLGVLPPELEHELLDAQSLEVLASPTGVQVVNRAGSPATAARRVCRRRQFGFGSVPLVVSR